MADAVAAPAAPAGTPSTTQSAAPDAKTPVADPKVPPETVADLNSELEALLKKHGGLKVKASGKERAVTSAQQLIRSLERGIPFEENSAKLAKEREEWEPKVQKVRDLESDDPATVRKALKAILGNKMTALALDEVDDIMQQEQRYKGETERERQYRLALEAAEAEKSKLQEGARKRAELAKKAEEEQEVATHLQTIADAAIGAFKALNLKPSLEPIALTIVRPLVHQMVKAGLPVTSDVLAERIQKTLGEVHSWSLTSLDDEGLDKQLGTEFGKRYQKRLLAKHFGGGQKPDAPAPQPTQNGTQQQKPPPGNPRF
jgi:hypothetical protein